MRNLLWLALLGCGSAGEAVLTDACEGDDCTRCTQDSECVVSHDPCSDVAYCGHIDDDPGITQTDCEDGKTYAPPAAERCVCDEVCEAETE